MESSTPRIHISTSSRKSSPCTTISSSSSSSPSSSVTDDRRESHTTAATISSSPNHQHLNPAYWQNDRSDNIYASSQDNDKDENEFDMTMLVNSSPTTTLIEGTSTNGGSYITNGNRIPTNTTTNDNTNTKQHIKNMECNNMLWDGLCHQNLNFPINTECTSLCLSPSGHFVWGGFSDGTLRVFDLTGQFSMASDEIWHGRQKTTMIVTSKYHQRFGAVASQIHARGVHTDLMTHIDVCGDYVFGGVPRGAMELHAVSIQQLEQHVMAKANSTPTSTPILTSHHQSKQNKNILDYIQVHVHADAKLKGFGACTQLINASRPTYLLLTGKGIKNIHIWKFQPPIDNEQDKEAIWEQLYDTPTNGNTIQLLQFYRNPLGQLWGVSQSDTQKLRLWDLTFEENQSTSQPNNNSNQNDKEPILLVRPKRPPYQDVVNSQGALGIAGGYGICGGSTMYNQFSIVSLDQPTSAYNHTELALPAVAGSTSLSSSSLSSLSTGRSRQRRGDLKQLLNVATIPDDSNHALLELDDGSIVHYMATDPKAGRRPTLDVLTEESTGIASLPADFWCRTLCLGKPTTMSGEVIMAAVTMYNPNTQLGHIEVRALQPLPITAPAPKAVPTPTTATPSSPMTTDSRALSRLCMEAPPPTTKKVLAKLQKKMKEKKMKKTKKRALDMLKDKDKKSSSGSMVHDVTLKTTTPARVVRKTSSFQKITATSALPISVESSTDKIKKRKKLVTATKVNGAATTVPSDNITSTPLTTAAKSKLMMIDAAHKDATITPSSKGAFSSNQPSPVESFSFKTKKVVPLSHPKNKSKSKDESTSCITPTQVSPSATTPCSENLLVGGTPSSTESFDQEGGNHPSIAKFMKPKRVLHQWTEQSQQQELQLQPPGTENSLAKVASPPVPRKLRKSCHESSQNVIKPKTLPTDKMERTESLASSLTNVKVDNETNNRSTTNVLGNNTVKLFQSSTVKTEHSSSNESLESTKKVKVDKDKKDRSNKHLEVKLDICSESMDKIERRSSNESLGSMKKAKVDSGKYSSLSDKQLEGQAAKSTEPVDKAERRLSNERLRSIKQVKVDSGKYSSLSDKQLEGQGAESTDSIDKAEWRLSNERLRSMKTESDKISLSNKQLEGQVSKSTESIKNAERQLSNESLASIKTPKVDSGKSSSLSNKQLEHSAKSTESIDKAERRFSNDRLRSTKKGKAGSGKSSSLSNKHLEGQSAKSTESNNKAEWRSSNESLVSVKKARTDSDKNDQIRKKTEKKIANKSSGLESQLCKTLKSQIDPKLTSDPLSASFKASTNPALSTADPPDSVKKKRNSNDASDERTDARTPQTGNKRQRIVEEEESMPSAADILDLKSIPASCTTSKTPFQEGSSTLSREERMLRQAHTQYRKIQVQIASLPKSRSRLLTQRANAFGRFPSNDSPSEQVRNEHCATYEAIQKRLLRSAESTLRLLVGRQMTVDAARSELRDTIRSFEEVLHDTLQRHELELEGLEGIGQDRNKKIPTWNVQGAFDFVDEVYHGLEPPKRAPGRPKTSY